MLGNPKRRTGTRYSQRPSRRLPPLDIGTYLSMVGSAAVDLRPTSAARWGFIGRFPSFIGWGSYPPRRRRRLRVDSLRRKLTATATLADHGGRPTLPDAPRPAPLLTRPGRQRSTESLIETDPPAAAHATPAISVRPWCWQCTCSLTGSATRPTCGTRSFGLPDY
jgi:hypothetical protein